MTQTQKPAEVRRTAVRLDRLTPSTGNWVALVVVLMGLFGMHGLAGHGSHASEMDRGDATVTMVEMPTTERVGMVGDDAVMTAHLGLQTHTGPTGAALGLPDAFSGAVSGGAMSVLCLAVLSAGTVLFLLLLRLRRPRVALAWMPAPTSFAFLGLGRDRDPPSLTALSIRRC